jgi:membrane-associated phospholipid phosphatase
MRGLIEQLRRPETWRPARPRTWWFDAALVAVFALVTVAVWQGFTAGLDESVARFCIEHFREVPAWYWTLRVFNYFGQGLLVSMIFPAVLTFLVWRRIRTWRAVLPWVCAYVLSYLTLGPIKVLTGRLAPANERSNAVELFNTPDQLDPAMSFPSGHVANAIVWWGIIAVLLGVLIPLSTRQVRWLRIVPPVVVLITTTLTAFHWITDGIAAIALGVLVSRLLQRVNWPYLLRPGPLAD